VVGFEVVEVVAQGARLDKRMARGGGVAPAAGEGWGGWKVGVVVAVPCWWWHSCKVPRTQTVFVCEWETKQQGGSHSLLSGRQAHPAAQVTTKCLGTAGI